MRKLLFIGGIFAIGAAVLAHALGRGFLGERQDAGEVTPPRDASLRVLKSAVRQRAARRAVGGPEAKQILFGDLHVHTTFSADAFTVGLPMFQGEGAHPPSDACDFARFCSGLDFWSINDHAEGLTPHQWSETKRAMRRCQEVAGEAEAPDLVSFLGWEWTQIGITPADHFGHKNVVLRDLDEGAVPARPIASRRELFPPGSGAMRLGAPIRLLLIAASPGSETRQPYLDLARFLEDRDDLEPCPVGVPVRALPPDCQESALTPEELFAKLDDWGFPHLVIPHGNTWGFYTPPGSSWSAQLAAHDEPERREPLFEVFSGHGSSEEYRSWRAVAFGDDGARCPEPSTGYVPSCWRAGEIVRDRCVAAGESAEECARRAGEARRNYVAAGTGGHVTVPAAEVTDWLDAGQCTDCYLPAFNYRPGGSVQYALALTNFDEPGRQKRFRFGFIASSDSHTARPGTGFKEQDRREMTDAGLGAIGRFIPSADSADARSVSVESGVRPAPEFERFASFFGTGGLVAVHSRGRDRDAIWGALESREVYGTSGERILLWFDLLTQDGRVLPMGSRSASGSNPRFRVRAVGAFHQKPGCPEHAVSALSAERLHQLCRDECYNPSDERKRVTRVEVIRIRPQASPGEPVEDLIEDPWRVFACPPEEDGCSVVFGDPEFSKARRDALYYVRAIQEPTPTVNGGQLRCEGGRASDCRSVSPCYADPRTDYEDDCLADLEERAWSSPIFLEFAANRAP